MRAPALPWGMGQRLFGPRPFARLVQTHLLSNAGDALFAVSLAGSLFFNVSLDAARPRIILYLAITMAPFAVVAPVIGPVIDRVPGGHRLVIGIGGLTRAAICIIMAGHLKTLYFYPEAFGILVLGKTYSVAKSALVPRIVDDPSALVQANSRLSRLGTVGGAVGGGVGVLLLEVAGAPWTLRAGALVYVAAGLMAMLLPKPRQAIGRRSRARAREELRTASVVLASWAMALVRGGVGFAMFLLAFALRREGAATWAYVAVLGAGGAGGFLGTFAAPRLRRRFREVPMLGIALAVPAAAAVAPAARYGQVTVIVAVLALGAGANVGRQAFDSLVQRNAPDADRGRAFAGFETRFQLAWVLGALLAVVSRPPAWLGLLLTAFILMLGAVLLLTGTRAAERREPLTEGPRVRDLLPVDDESPVTVHLLLTAERLAGEGEYEQAVLIAAAAADLISAVEGDDHVALVRLRAQALTDGAAVGASEAATAIAIAARAVEGTKSRQAPAGGDQPTDRRSVTSHPSPTRSTT